MNRDRLKQAADLIEQGIEGVAFSMANRFYVAHEDDAWDDLFDEPEEPTRHNWAATAYAFDALIEHRPGSQEVRADLAGFIQLKFAQKSKRSYCLLAAAFASDWLELPDLSEHVSIDPALQKQLPHQVVDGTPYLMFTAPQTFGFSTAKEVGVADVANTLRSLADFPTDIDEELYKYAKTVKNQEIIPSLIEWLGVHEPTDEELWD